MRFGGRIYHAMSAQAWQLQEFPEVVGRRIRAARAIAGLESQEDLGKLIGYSGGEIGRWERGEVGPREPILNAIAEACGLSRSFFTDEWWEPTLRRDGPAA